MTFVFYLTIFINSFGFCNMGEIFLLFFVYEKNRILRKWSHNIEKCVVLQVLIELPYCLVQTVIYALITYSMINFTWTAPKFFYYMFVMFFSLLYFTYYGMMTVALTPNGQVAAIVASGFYSIFNLFSGFLIFRPVSKNFLELQKWVFFLFFHNFFPFRF